MGFNARRDGTEQSDPGDKLGCNRSNPVESKNRVKARSRVKAWTPQAQEMRDQQEPASGRMWRLSRAENGLRVSGWRSRSSAQVMRKRSRGLGMTEARFWASQDRCKQALTAHNVLFLH